MRVMCINKGDYTYISVGRTYAVLGETQDFYRIRNDHNERFAYPKNLFEAVTPTPKPVPQIRMLTLPVPQGAVEVVVRIPDSGPVTWTWDCA